MYAIWLLANLSGAIGSSIATPTDLVKVRMQAQGKLKEGEEKRYKNTFKAFREIFREGGIKALYVGVGPTVKRAAILTATQVLSVVCIIRKNFLLHMMTGITTCMYLLLSVNTHKHTHSRQRTIIFFIDIALHIGM